ncbi:hypothetical protein J3R82DRAFT_516 [Butyriboletus roseoflavus]|nr:hypothetical protein J3R82DRAFT_516 [Butyriboletus roseoflavus]
MSLADNEDDPSFLALSAHLRHRVDSALDSIVSSGAQLQQSRFEASSGGFIVEESASGPSQSSAEYEAGGFIVEDFPSSSSDGRSHIPLSEIPRALDLLDLFPDEDIMGVFKNAATGWGAQNARNDGVSRKDWRAVCAALLEGEHIEGSDKESEDVEMGVDSGPDSDEYQTEELSGDTDEASSDEYEEAAGPRKAQKVPRRTPTKSFGTGDFKAID